MLQKFMTKCHYSNINLKKAIQIISECQNIVFLTGAGISVASGVPTFRGEGGFYKGFNAEEILTNNFLKNQPQIIWEFFRDFQNLIRNKKPNKNHFAISRLQQFFHNRNMTLITQNIDNFHLEAYPLESKYLGFHPKILQIHGNLNYIRCTKRCQEKLEDQFAIVQPMPDLNAELFPKCKVCGEQARPHVLLFDEFYDDITYQRSNAIWAGINCDCLVVIGTQLQTGLSHSIVKQAVVQYKKIIEINPDPIILINEAIQIKAKAEDVVEDLCNGVIEMLS